MNQNVYFIADTHFGDQNIMKYENRPFADVVEMDEAIIENWNKTVNVEDEIFVLGDFSFYELEKTTEICTRLNGSKSLILGNHDMNETDYYRACGFEEVYKYPVLYEGYWILSHEPLYINQNMPYANIFGHVHQNKTYVDYSEQSFCVCIERLDYRPIVFHEIKKRMESIK